MGKVAKISSKGQVTIPKEIRNYLNSQVVEFDIEDDRVIVRAVKKIAGNLKHYADSNLIPQEATAWEKAIKEKHDYS